MNNYFDNVLNDTFNFIMDAESRKVSLHYGGQEVKAFYRRNADTTNTKDTAILYYGLFEPVKAGSLIDFRGKTFLALNDETAENNIYRKSGLVQTNGTITTFDLTAEDLPVWANNVLNETVASGEMIRLIDGNLRLITEDCSESRKLKIDDVFNEFGRTWKISNVYYKDGLCNIMAEVVEDSEPEFSYRIEFVDFETN